MTKILSNNQMNTYELALFRLNDVSQTTTALRRLPLYADGSTCSRECKSNAVIGFIQEPQRKPYPQRIEEDQIDPQVHEVASIQVRTAGQPLWRKCHESFIQYQPGVFEVVG